MEFLNQECYQSYSCCIPYSVVFSCLYSEFCIILNSVFSILSLSKGHFNLLTCSL